MKKKRCGKRKQKLFDMNVVINYNENMKMSHQNYYYIEFV